MNQQGRIKEPPTFLKILIFLLAYLGISHISLDFKKSQITYSKLYDYVTKVLLLIVAVIMIINLQAIYELAHVEKYPRFTVTILVSLYLFNGSFFFFLITIANKLNQNLIIVVFSKINDCIQKYQSRFSKYDINSLVFLEALFLIEILIYDFLFLFTVMLNGVIWDADLHLILFVCFENFRRLVFATVEIFYFTFLIHIARTFTQCDELYNAACNREDVLEVRKCLKMHQELCYLTRLVNKTFSFQLLFLIGHCFALFFMHSFGIYSQYIYNFENATGIGGIYVYLEVVSKLFTYAYISSRVVDKANKIKRTSFGVSVNITNNYIRREVNALGLQLCHDELEITAGGFFKIDFSLLFEVMAATSTYLIITIQFVDVNI